MRAALALAALALWCTPAHAELVPRAEDGAVRYLMSEPEGLQNAVEVGRGDAVWAETLRATRLVRLTGAGIDRVRPGRAAGLAAGDVLFGYELSTGFAYCPVRPSNVELRRVQCYRDFDGDGRFEGTYVTDARGAPSMLLPGGLRGLAAMPPVPYEQADDAVGPEGMFEVVFTGWRGGAAEFRFRVEEEWVGSGFRCQPNGDGICDVMGLSLRVTDLGGQRARIEALSVREGRSVRVCFDSPAPRSLCARGSD